jgi:hypothetical protein
LRRITARFESHAGGLIADPERIGGEVAVRHIVGEPLPQVAAGTVSI